MEALNVLNSIPQTERTGRWYYYSAMTQEGLGNRATAIEQIRQAVAYEPSNTQYRQFQQYLEYGGNWYAEMGSGYSRPYSGVGSFCWKLFWLQLLCSCCCRI